ncbi:MAG: hypothetical protein ACYC6L_16430 [Anaerolineae bacterium]
MRNRILQSVLLLGFVLLLAACQAAPTASPTAVATSTPAQAAAPTATAGPTQEPVPVYATIQDYKPQSFCDNPYMPLRNGTEWALSTIDVVMTLKVQQITTTGSESVALVRRAYDFGEQYDQAWRCTADGMYGYDITSYNNTNGLVLPVATITHTGYYLPRADLLVPGYEWEEYSITYTQGYTVTTDQHYKVVSANPVNVLGQQVPGLQVHVTGKMSALSDQGKTTARDLDYMRVFGLGVGLVKEDELELRKLTMVE